MRRKPYSYSVPSFPPPERTSNPGLNRRLRSFPSRERTLPFQPQPPFEPHRTSQYSSSWNPIPSSSTDRHVDVQGSQLDYPFGEAFPGGRPNEFIQPMGHQQQSAIPTAGGYYNRSNYQIQSSNNRVYSLGQSTSRVNVATLVDQQAALHQPSASLLSIFPPPQCLVSYAARHDDHAMRAFPNNAALRGFLDCLLHSLFIHNQDPEPLFTDDYGRYVLHQAARLQGCPQLDFSNPRQSILTVLVGKSNRGRPHCLICGNIRGSLPRILGCVRSHLQFKPFRCNGEGCLSCNSVTGYATFWTRDLLREHLTGQTMATCAKCGASLRQGSMKRHWDTQHEEDVEREELIDFLLEEDDSDQEISSIT